MYCIGYEMGRLFAWHLRQSVDRNIAEHPVQYQTVQHNRVGKHHQMRNRSWRSEILPLAIWTQICVISEYSSLQYSTTSRYMWHSAVASPDITTVLHNATYEQVK